MTFLRERKILVANLSLVMLLLIGAAYLTIDIARVQRPGSTYSVTVQLGRSGGLQAGNDVTWRGYRVGSITAIDLIDGGAEVSATAKIDDRWKIPADTDIHVGALSAAGEQYLDFRPRTDNPPFLHDGQVIAFNPDRITTPVPIWETLANSNDLIAQIDPDKYAVILDNLNTALSGGPDQLRGLIDGLSLATTGLDNRLPQTIGLIESLQVIAGTSSHAQPDLETLTRNSQLLVTQARNADGELRHLLDNAPEQLAVANATLDRNMDPIQSLITTMSAIVRAALLRLPALRALFPALVIGTSAMGVPAHDGEFYTIVDAWPRPWCQYSTRALAAFIVTIPTFSRWNYCTDPPADQQIRGSANAPRPDVPNNGAHLPTGVDPNERTLPPIR
ncbi:MlaD family protein [Nocardia sp. CDC153]|uniref:MlaD family protein n=1 Tax=Nocardia sp. CDC153 TaxID=3112167 RepID=UPI002DB5F60F|nr:MlaD family protein [Nocardia sp. CDC153]MEC3957613.1 MlaD family protein [Nocardia sp. CDC153]